LRLSAVLDTDLRVNMRKSNPLPSFFWKVYITSIVLVFFTVLCVTVIFRNIQKRSYFNQIQQEFKTEAFLLGQIFSKAQNPDIIEEWRRKGKTRITVINENGDVLLETMYNPFKMDNQLHMPEVSEALASGWGMSVRWCEYVGMKMFFVAGFFEYRDRPSMIIRLALPVYQIKRMLNNSTSMIILGSVVIFIVFSLFGLLIAREITNPMMHIATIIKKFSNGNIDVRLPYFRNKELNLLSTELNRMIENLTRGEGELSIVSSMHDGIILIDKNGIIKQSNRAAGEIFGYKEQDLLGKNIYAVFQSGGIRESIRSISSGHDIVKGQIRIFVPDERDIEFSFTPFGDGVGVLVVLHDITRIARLERIRGEFVANVSHELKTPITSLKGFVEILLGMDGADNKTQKKFLDIIDKNILRMENIIEDLLTLSRIESGTGVLEDNPVNVNLCINSAISIIQSRFPERKVVFSGNDFDFYIKGDEDMVELILINLLDNAMKYSNDLVKVNLDANYRKVVLSISDKGIGIPEREIDKIFESFYRVDKARSRALGGTGLGLTIVKHLVEAHKGKISVKSNSRKGSLFKLEFPRYVNY